MWRPGNEATHRHHSHSYRLAGQTFAARGGEGGAREWGKRTSGHFRQVFVDVAGMLALPIRLESVQ